MAEPITMDFQSNKTGSNKKSNMRRSRETFSKNITEAAQLYHELSSMLSNSKSSLSTLRPDVKRLKDEHLAMNLNKNIQSQASLAKDYDTLSVSD